MRLRFSLAIALFSVLAASLVAACSGSSTAKAPTKTPVVVRGVINRVLGAVNTDFTVSLVGMRDRVRPDIQGRFVLEAPAETSDLTVAFETPEVTLEADIDDIPEGTETVLASFDLQVNRGTAELEEVRFLSASGSPIKE